ncbi:MAG: extracellular solute-binding protein [Caldilineaceae bacterium]|nr:extracellular solute-binding protein [Caldilineaceae bacterium]
MNGKRLSRRAFLQVLGGSSAALLLAGCPAAPAPAPQAGSGAAPAAPAQEAITLDFFAWGDQTDLPAWEELSRNYTEMNPNVTINVSPTPPGSGGSDYYAALQTQFAGGAAPHIASFQGWEWQPYADRDLLAPLDDYIEQSGLTGPYPEGVQSLEVSTRRNGSRYLLPLQIATMVMFYVPKLFEEAGVDLPTDDWTFEDFLAKAEAITDTSGDRRRYGYQANGNWVRDIHWIRGTGVQEFDELVDPRQAMFDQPEIAEVVQIVAQDVIYNMGVAPLPADTDTGANTIQTGNAAMKYEGPWFFTQLNSPALRESGQQIEFDVVLMPQQQDSERPHRGWAEGVAVPRTNRADAAWGFVSYMGGADGNRIYSTITGRIPNDLSLIESFWVPAIAERFGVQNGAAFVEAIRRSEVDVIGGVSRTRMWNEVVRPQGWDRLNNNSATAADVLPTVNAGVQALLDDYWANQ